MKNSEYITDEYEIHPLEWDTVHFGASSAKVILKKQISLETICNIKDICCEYEFLTIVNENNVAFDNFLIGQYTNAFLVDMQVVFAKTVENTEFYDDIEITNNFPFNQDIIRITSNNFVYSRFYNDPYIDKQKADELYAKWATTCFNKDDKYFAVCRNNGNIEGVFLFAFDDKGDLSQSKGFLVVDKSYQGKGVAKRIIKSMESFAFNKGSKLLYGGTQVDNIKMINHYISDGYKLIEKKSIYHLWASQKTSSK